MTGGGWRIGWAGGILIEVGNWAGPGSVQLSELAGWLSVLLEEFTDLLSERGWTSTEEKRLISILPVSSVD